MNITTPVVLIIFNRPDVTKLVFEVIASAKPKKLFVVADGPRFQEDVEKCERTRAIIKQVNWDCEVLTNFSEKNLGCGIRPATGLDWVFSQCEEAIILEDDCLPSPSFFSFCQTLLEYYRDDKRVMHISGNNFQRGQRRTAYSYYFSKYTHNWGWATWRRAWKYFDYTIQSWSEFRDNLMTFVCDDPYEQRYWTEIFDHVYSGVKDIWDAQWLYTCWSQSGLAILPELNLVSNIGFGPDATHTFHEFQGARVPSYNMNEIVHPSYVLRHKDADQDTFDNYFGGNRMKAQDRLLTTLKNRVSHLIKSDMGQQMYQKAIRLKNHIIQK